jgi:hypothetical protein
MGCKGFGTHQPVTGVTAEIMSRSPAAQVNGEVPVIPVGVTVSAITPMLFELPPENGTPHKLLAGAEESNIYASPGTREVSESSLVASRVIPGGYVRIMMEPA